MICAHKEDNSLECTIMNKYNAFGNSFSIDIIHAILFLFAGSWDLVLKVLIMSVSFQLLLPPKRVLYHFHSSSEQSSTFWNLTPPLYGCVSSITCSAMEQWRWHPSLWSLRLWFGAPSVQQYQQDRSISSAQILQSLLWPHKIAQQLKLLIFKV